MNNILISLFILAELMVLAYAVLWFKQGSNERN